MRDVRPLLEMAMQKFSATYKKQIKILYPKIEKYFIANMQIFFCNCTNFFLDIVEILTSKIMVKISKEKRMKMAQNMSQQAVALEFGISRSSISEILFKFQGTWHISKWPRRGCPQLHYRMVQKLIKTVLILKMYLPT